MKKRIIQALFLVMFATSLTFVGCKDYDDDVDNLQEQINNNKSSLESKLSALDKTLESAKADLSTAQSAVAAAKIAVEEAKTAALAAQTTGDAAAKEAADAAKAAAEAKTLAGTAQAAAAQAKVDAIEEAKTLVANLQAIVDTKVNQSDFDAKIASINATIGALSARIESLETTTATDAAIVALNVQVAALQNFQKSMEALNLPTVTSDVATLKTNISTLLSEMNAIKSSISAANGDITSLTATLTELSNKVNSLSTNLTTVSTSLNTVVSLISSRMTSLVFAPSDYVNGVEAIVFNTLNYKPWANLLADASDGKTTSSINDGKTAAFYYVNPSTVKLDEILGMTVLTNDATQTLVRSITSSSLTVTPQEVAGGKMKVTFKKNTTEGLNGSGVQGPNGDGTYTETFTIVALQAKIKLTEEEEKAGVSPTVVSDWARLYERTVNPYIHYKKKYSITTETNVTEDLDNGVIPHFYPYTKIHNAATVDGVNNTKEKYIIQNVEYTKTLDLKTLVGVCDKKDKEYNAADYGLSFEFNLVDYYLQDGPAQQTNQKNFAKITDGVISSTAHDGTTTQNKDAIGREPLIQVVLKYTDASGNKEVVDVRYFKIKWTGVSSSQDLGLIEEFSNAFTCDDLGNFVKTKAMNEKVYTVLNVSKEAFHNNNTLDNNLYKTLDEAKAGTNAQMTLGTITEVPNAGDQTTYNLKWKFNAGDMNITQAEFEARKAVRTVYGRYVSNDGLSIYTFSLKVTIDLDVKLAGYNGTYWNGTLSSTDKNKQFKMNAALTSDANYGSSNFYDTQFITSILHGYVVKDTSNNPTTATNANDLITSATASNAEFVFDQDRLTEVLGSASSSSWNVRDNGRSLYYDNVKAAEITSGYGIKLYENPYPTASAHGAPTSPAISLVGKDVPVKLVANFCNYQFVVDRFKVYFIEPLAVTINNTGGTMYDVTTAGSTVDVSKLVTIKEAYTYNAADVLYVSSNALKYNVSLLKWYDVTKIEWDFSNALTNLKYDGTNITVGSSINQTWNSFAAWYILTPTPAYITGSNVSTGNTEYVSSVKFENKSQSKLQGAFKVSVPVKVYTKWGVYAKDSAPTYVTFTINP